MWQWCGFSAARWHEEAAATSECDVTLQWMDVSNGCVTCVGHRRLNVCTVSVSRFVSECVRERKNEVVKRTRVKQTVQFDGRDTCPAHICNRYGNLIIHLFKWMIHLFKWMIGGNWSKDIISPVQCFQLEQSDADWSVLCFGFSHFHHAFHTNITAHTWKRCSTWMLQWQIAGSFTCQLLRCAKKKCLTPSLVNLVSLLITGSSLSVCLLSPEH